MAIVVVEIVDDGLLQFVDALEDAAADALSGDLGEEPTILSQDPDVGVKCNWKRGCNLIQRFTAGVL